MRQTAREILYLRAAPHQPGSAKAVMGTQRQNKHQDPTFWCQGPVRQGFHESLLPESSCLCGPLGLYFRAGRPRRHTCCCCLPLTIHGPSHASFCRSCIKSGLENRSISSCTRRCLASWLWTLSDKVTAVLAGHAVTALLFFRLHSWGLRSCNSSARIKESHFRKAPLSAPYQAVRFQTYCVAFINMMRDHTTVQG